MMSKRIRTLSRGADDYLVKPFAFSELLAPPANLHRGSVSIRSDPGQGTRVRLVFSGEAGNGCPASSIFLFPQQSLETRK
jgi:DNA-binding response OmpR family regulator